MSVPPEQSASTQPLQTEAAPPGQFAGTLLFYRTVYPDDQAFFLLNENGERQLTDFGEICCTAAASPDKRRLAVMPGTDVGTPLQGATIDLTTGDLVPLPIFDPTLNLIPGAWSPDGQRIAFLGFDEADPSRRGMYTADADGGGLFRVTTRPGELDDAPLEYSPDGDWLLFYRSVAPDPDPQVGGSLWIVHVDGTDPHPVAEASAHPASWAQWSPDGQSILFGNERTAPSGSLWTVRPDGTELTELFADPTGRFPILPIWSPDGTQIMFALDPTNDQFTHPPNELYLIDADGTNLRLVLGGHDFKRPAAWWPTGDAS